MIDQALDNRILMERASARAAAMIETDRQARDALPDQAVSEANRAPGLRPIDILERACTAYADRPALGYRAGEIVENAGSGKRTLQYLQRYDTISYRELWRRASGLAAAWHWHEDARVRARDFVCILGFASADYVIVDIACLYAGATSIPLQTNMPAPDLRKILEDTQPACFVVSLDNAERVLPVLCDAGRAINVVVMDYEPADDGQRARFETVERQASAIGPFIHLTTLAGLIDFGAAEQPIAPATPETGEDPLATLMYTSGSTGSPKGAMVPESNWVKTFVETPPPLPVISMAYHPLNHSLGRTVVIRTLIRGGLVNFVLKSDMSTLFEDIRLVRPTLLELVPRISELIYHEYQTAALRRCDGDEDRLPAAQAEVMAEMRHSFLGDRLLTGVLTTAPTAPEIQAFLKRCFDIPVFNTLGSTESAGITIEGRILRPPVIDYKLVDVPELNYFSTDKPFPRGELRLKSQRNIAGYFKNPEATAALFDTDGYLTTGDIYEERAPDHIVWIDRKNNVLKLSQGEFVTIGPLETQLEGGSPLIEQVYLYGNSERAYLLAVIVPHIDACRNECGEIPSDAELKRKLREAINEIARTHQLRSYEIPRDFIVELEPFTPQNGLLTDVRKPRRPNLKSKYGERLEALYVQLEEQQIREFVELTREGASASVIEKVRKAIEATLGLADIDLSGGLGFTELGGDSLSSVSLSLLMEQMFGIKVPLSVILNPTGGLQGLARYIEGVLATGGDGGLPDFATVHGTDAVRLDARDLRLEKFIDAPTLAAAGQRQGHVEAPPAETVLLTGANGFLGRFLCLEWMARVAPHGGKVICIVRGSDAADARMRLTRIFERDDPQLASDFNALAQHHLEVIAGDLVAPRLGLSNVDYARIADETDTIVHVGAMVNHVLSYEQLFEPNVVGTAGLIRLALTGRTKQFDFVSSSAALIGTSSAMGNPEDEDIRILRPSMQIGSAYASGYGATKWAGEILLREAHEQFGLPVNIYRSDMILPHSLYRGQINAPDMFIRILFSIIATRLAPSSFYQAIEDGGHGRLHYGGLPVDFTAEAIAGIGAERHRDFRTYAVINTHREDGISLDRIVDWLQSKGHAVERIDDYHLWLQRFTAGLRGLTQDQQQLSSLPLLDQLAHPTPAGNGRDTNGTRFHAKVRELRIGREEDIPHLSKAYIHKCLDDMVYHGLVTDPKLDSLTPQEAARENF